MPRRTGTFENAGETSLEVLVQPGQSYYLSLTADPSLTGSIALQSRALSNQVYEDVVVYTDSQAGTEYVNQNSYPIALRLYCREIDSEEPETVAYELQSLISTDRELVSVGGKVGATAGWLVNAAADTGLLAALPAEETGATLVLPLSGLKVGTAITGLYPVGQVESAGGEVSLTIALRKQTAVAADVADAVVATTGAVALDADTLLGRIGALALDNLNVTVADGESYYLLITGTTAASTDVALQGVMLQKVS